MRIGQSTGDNYLAYRPKYPQALYSEILSYHDSSANASRQLCVDIGCGPGIVTVAVAPSFERVLGVDPSDSMIKTAKQTLKLDNVTYEVGSAEDMTTVKDASVDLVIGGTMAHWLDPEPWYREMARILKPDGTIAVFCYGWSVLPLSLIMMLIGRIGLGQLKR